MKKKLTLVVSAILVATFGSGNVVAQDVPTFIPVEIFTCNYNDGKGAADLDAVVELWTKYMDDAKNDSYAAWTMTKHYASDDQTFDVAWIGASKSGTAMGEGNDHWLANGGEVGAAFSEVLTCGMTGLYASRMFKAPPDGNTPEGGVLVFSNCSTEEGARYEDVVAATNTWAGILDEAGSKAAIYHWYPIYGTGEDDIGWKVITAYPSHAELGKSYDLMAGGLYLKSRELFGDSTDCDVARVYNVKSRRSASIRN